MSSETDFKLVHNRKKNRKIHNTARKACNIHNLSNTSEEKSIDKGKALKRILLYQEEILTSKFYNCFIKSLSKVIEDVSEQISSVVCFGLGEVGDCSISQYQLGLLLNILKQYNIPKAYVHDPIFSSIECNLLQHLGLDIIFENKEGKFHTGSNVFTIVYFPHCPKQLMNNFLWKNWGPHLKNCIIIGNSFSKILETNSSKYLEEQVQYIAQIFPYCTEYTVENNFKFADIFNDTSIHQFPKEKLSLIEPEFWMNKVEPVYAKDDTEYITSSLKSKLEI